MAEQPVPRPPLRSSNPDSGPPPPATVEVFNGGRKIRFEGSILATVTSERARASRWTVMSMYRTTRGLYVIHRVGRSTVYHTSDCHMAQSNRLQYGHELAQSITSAEMLALAPCQDCGPRATDPVEQLRFEQDRHWAGVADTPDAAIDMLHRTNNGTRSLPWIAANLLQDASVWDKELASAYMTETL